MRLDVLVSGELSAHLEVKGLRFELTYLPGATRAISLRLPLRHAPYPDEECHSFFAHLLPEGAWRSSLCRQLGIDEADDGALLAAIGADCAGAVSVVAEATPPTRGHYVPLAHEEVRRWVLNPLSRPRIQLTPGLRLSLAGAQDKLLLRSNGGELFLCEDGAPSNLIVKPDIRDPLSGLELTALNELWVMRLATRVGLDVARHTWICGAYATERFDRQGQERLHQEDFAQLLGLSPSEKYRVSWQDCFAIVDDFTSEPVRARLELTDRLLFNLLVGNMDAHGKNFSLLRLPGGKVQLSPAYDLSSTSVYPALNTHFAMHVGAATNLDELSTKQLRSFARTVKLGFPYLERRAKELSVRTLESAPTVLPQLEEELPELRKDVYPRRRRVDLVARIQHVIATNAERLRANLSR